MVSNPTAVRMDVAMEHVMLKYLGSVLLCLLLCCMGEFELEGFVGFLRIFT